MEDNFQFKYKIANQTVVSRTSLVPREGPGDEASPGQSNHNHSAQ